MRKLGRRKRQKGQVKVEIGKIKRRGSERNVERRRRRRRKERGEEGI